ncbi:phloem protein 2-like protein [Tanacetum coccineum]
MSYSRTRDLDSEKVLEHLPSLQQLLYRLMGCRPQGAAVGVETILLEEVKSATENFSNKRLIGSGASGNVYKGELRLFKTSIPVAVKLLDHKGRSYGEGEFLKEVAKLCRYVHKNIITLRGFCEEGNEKIIFIDHAINGSLDKHLHKSSVTWELQLKISIGATKGLNYIHSFE